MCVKVIGPQPCRGLYSSSIPSIPECLIPNLDREDSTARDNQPALSRNCQWVTFSLEMLIDRQRSVVI